MPPLQSGGAVETVAGAGTKAMSDVQPIWSSTLRVEDEVHLWTIPIAAAGNWAWALPQPDLDKADRFRSAEDRHRFEVSHGALRLLLSRYLGRPAGAISITEGPNGKPGLADEAGLSFNMTHSKTTVVIAMAWDMALGVDIEPLQAAGDFDRIAGQFFSPSEAAELARMDQPRRGVAFLEAWTRKEAIAKALGVGVAVTLQALRSPLGPTDGLPVVIEDPLARRQICYLYDLDGVPAHIGALATSRRPRRIRPRVLN